MSKFTSHELLLSGIMDALVIAQGESKVAPCLIDTIKRYFVSLSNELDNERRESNVKQRELRDVKSDLWHAEARVAERTESLKVARSRIEELEKELAARTEQPKPNQSTSHESDGMSS